jgi:hypothetical protein
VAGAGLTYRDWRERVPELLEAAVARWGLTLGQAYPPGAGGHVVLHVHAETARWLRAA